MGTFNAYAASLLVVAIISSNATLATDRCDQAIGTVDRLTVERDRLFSKAPEDEPARAARAGEREAKRDHAFSPVGRMQTRRGTGPEPEKLVADQRSMRLR